MKLQANKSDFLKYKESIDLIKNKNFHQMFNDTTCLIDDTVSEYMFDDLSEEDNTCLIDTTTE
jgi:hypothetical protein